MIKSVKIACLLIFSLLICGTASAAMEGGFSDPAQPIKVVRVAPIFTITLASNPSTGYSWVATKYDPNFLKVVKHTYYPPAKQMPGAGGKEVWIVRVEPLAFNSPHGPLSMTMVYGRPSGHEIGKISVFNIQTT